MLSQGVAAKVSEYKPGCEYTVPPIVILPLQIGELMTKLIVLKSDNFYNHLATESPALIQNILLNLWEYPVNGGAS